MAKFVNESLVEFKDNQLINKLIVEGFNFSDLKKLKNPRAVLNNLIKKTNIEPNDLKRIKLIGALIVLTSYFLFPRSIISNNDAESKALELSRYDNIEINDIYAAAEDIIEEENLVTSEIEIDNEKISNLNSVVPNRFSPSKKDRYNKYDSDIIQASEELKKEGETPDPKLIKAIMLIETGMIPRKNSLGYEGFPQTKMHIVQGINKRFNKDFNHSDLYDPKESAKFIHYMIKALKKSKYVNLDSEAAAAYNWGLGNFSKYKLGKKQLPTETSNYIDMIKALI